MTTEEQLSRYHVARLHKTATRHLVRTALRHWRRLGLVEPTTENLERYRDLRLSEGAAPATVRGELNKLVPLAKWLGESPVVRLPLSPARCPVAWTPQQTRRLLYEARHTKRTIWGIAGKVYWPALLGVAFDTGERIGALLQVRGRDIEHATGQIYCVAEVRKGGYCDAVFILRRGTLRHLRRLQQLAAGDPLFLHGSPSTLWKAYTRLLADAGLPTDRRSKFHRLRRTAATRAYQRGEDATALLGHSTDAVTRRSYIDWSQIRRPWWKRWLG